MLTDAEDIVYCMVHDDWEIVRYCRSYGSRYFDILIRRHFSLVVNICFRFLGNTEAAQEATQDIFLKLYQSLDTIRFTGQPFKHWLCRVTANHCRNIIKRNKRAYRIMNEGEVDFWYNSSLFENGENLSIERREEIEIVNRALAKLPFKERTVLVLHSIAELGVAEISDVLKKPQYTIRRRLKSAKKRLKKNIVHLLGGKRWYGDVR